MYKTLKTQTYKYVRGMEISGLCSIAVHCFEWYYGIRIQNSDNIKPFFYF